MENNEEDKLYGQQIFQKLTKKKVNRNLVCYSYRKQRYQDKISLLYSFNRYKRRNME